MNLANKYRPQNLTEVIGHENVKQTLMTKFKEKSVPNVIMLSGPTGVGKTTLARIIAEAVGCLEPNLTEVNTADVRGIDSVRDMKQIVYLRPMGGGSRVWILDEAVQLPRTTQQAFLELLEFPPEYAYFIFCTTETVGLLPTLLGRCFRLQLQALDRSELLNVLSVALEGEKRELGKEVLLTIATRADGSARQALQLLEAALAHTIPARQLEAVDDACSPLEGQGEFLGRLLTQGGTWGKVCEALKGVEDKDLEGLRRQVLAYAAKCMNGSLDTINRAWMVIKAFEEPFYTSGKAGMFAACWCVVKQQRRE